MKKELEVGKHYYFLDDVIYSPINRKVIFGSRVLIDRIENNGTIHLIFNNGEKGLVANSDIFASCSTLNRDLISIYKNKIKEIKKLYKQAYEILDNLC